MYFVSVCEKVDGKLKTKIKQKNVNDKQSNSNSIFLRLIDRDATKHLISLSKGNNG